MTSAAPARQLRFVMPRRHPASGPAGAHAGERLPPVFTWVLLLVILPLFAQCFYYLIEIPPAYLLSKAWPVLMAPLAIWAIVRLPLPAKSGYALLLAYTMGLTPLISMIELGNGFFDALTTTVKVWPFTYYFGLSALLLWLSPEEERLRQACISLGFATITIMLLLWMVAPTSWYTSDPSQGKLMLFEQERGYRIYMPMFFGMLLLFYLVRRFMRRPSLWPAAGVLAILALELIIYKQRASIGAAVLVTGWGVLSSLPAKPRRMAIAAAGLFAPLAAAAFFLQYGDHFTEWLGGSLSVRQNSFALATGFLGTDVWHWIFGVGATTRFSAVTLADIFGNAQFYIADLGWVGVIFEYGLAGALLLLGLYVWGFLAVYKAARSSGDPFVAALADYVLFLIITSTVYSLVFTPGELATVMALAVYLDRRAKSAPAARTGGPTFTRTAQRRTIGIGHAATAPETLR
ncbi:hypothetical protein [Azorhizobium doebereinerae]|uniref:hypothetical protein n=1 Tax=Azorhizobium doebereinerae TaxID=281091 RepID=UPI0003FDECA8|nr:hypothetical protein [Azorhizobium doebereinerae]